MPAAEVRLGGGDRWCRLLPEVSGRSREDNTLGAGCRSCQVVGRRQRGVERDGGQRFRGLPVRGKHGLEGRVGRGLDSTRSPAGAVAPGAGRARRRSRGWPSPRNAACPLPLPLPLPPPLHRGHSHTSVPTHVWASGGVEPLTKSRGEGVGPDSTLDLWPPRVPEAGVRRARSAGKRGPAFLPASSAGAAEAATV